MKLVAYHVSLLQGISHAAVVNQHAVKHEIDRQCTACGKRLHGNFGIFGLFSSFTHFTIGRIIVSYDI